MINPIRHIRFANCLLQNLHSLRQLQVNQASSRIASLYRPLSVSAFKFKEASAQVSAKTGPIAISDSCLKRLKEIKQTSPNKFLRITVDSGGCSGFEYKFSLDSDIAKEDDLVIEREGCKVLIDKQSVDFIKGSTIDYFEELIRTGFRILDNPNSDHSCSCGSSFSVKL